MNTDSEIQQNVTDALNWDAALDSSKLTVSVRDNFVTLKEQFCNHAEKIEARRAAQCVAGVRTVILRIEVVPMDVRSNSEIANDMIQTLSWGSGLPGDGVTVWVVDGWVPLCGAVDWNYQRRNAANAVCFLAGVKGFINNMTWSGAGD
jgi:osmotically-inducible protein OsmY